MQESLQQCIVQAEQAEQQLQWDQAADFYKEALGISPNYLKAKEKLAWCLSRAKYYKDAEKEYKDLVRFQPEVAKWPYAVGYQFYDMKKWREAIEWFDRALELKPDYIVVLYRKGYAYSQLIKEGRAEAIRETLKAFVECRKRWSELPDGTQKQQDKANCAKAAYHQAKVLLDHPTLIHDGAGAAIPLLKEAIQLDPNDHNKYYLLGKTYLENNQSEQAQMAFQEADRLEPNQDYILDKWAEALSQLGRFEEALELYQRIPFRQRKGYILRNQGHLYYLTSNYEHAEKILQQATLKDPRNHNGHYYLGLCYCATGKLNLAFRELKEAIQLKQKLYNRPFHEAQKELDNLLTKHPEIAVEPLKKGRQRGTVIRYVDDRGFGFIESDSNTQIFFHIKDCQGCDHIEKGIHVEFEEVMSDKGPKATRVICIDATRNG